MPLIDPRRHPATLAGFILLFAQPLAAAEPLWLPVYGSAAGTGAGLAASVFSAEPEASFWNPAANADRELPAAAVAAGAAASGGFGGFGGFLRAAAAAPTDYGQVWAGADLGLGDGILAAWPQAASAAAGISKRVGDRISLGIGFGGGIAAAGSFTWSLGGSVGAELEFPKLAPAGSRLAAALLAAGPAWFASGGATPDLGLTPILVWRSDFVAADRLRLSGNAAVASTALRSLDLAFGLSGGFGPGFQLDLAWEWPLFGAAGWGAPSPWPTVALRLSDPFVLKTGDLRSAPSVAWRRRAGFDRFEAAVLVSRGALDRQGPSIWLTPPIGEAFSPKKSTSLRLGLSIRDESRLASWEAVVYDDAGKRVFRQGEAVPTETVVVWPAVLWSRKRSVTAPTGLSVPLAGLADGTYRLRIDAQDEYGNSADAAEWSFSVDGTPPQVTVSAPTEAIFTPNGDGSRDFFRIDQSGSREALWSAEIRASGGPVVRRIEWASDQPSGFFWDGRNDSGAPVEDGNYEYSIGSVDEAGNAGGAALGPIIVDAAPAPLDIVLSAELLAPDSAGPYAVLDFSLVAPRRQGLIAWEAAVVDAAGAPVRRWSGSVAALDKFVSDYRFDGRSDAGENLPDGRYRILARLSYANGTKPERLSSPFAVDTRVPTGKVRADALKLALDGAHWISLYHDLSAGAVWTGSLVDAAGQPVRGFDLGRSPAGLFPGAPGARTEATVAWNGLDDSGRPVPDGVYRYVASGTGPTGLRGESNPIEVQVQSTGGALALLSDRSVFSPLQADGAVALLPRIERTEGIAAYALEIADASGQVRRRFAAEAAVPAVIRWDGSDDAGVTVEDGDYRASMRIAYDNGATLESAGVGVAVDAQAPRVQLSLTDTLFSPNGDGARDTVAFLQTVSPETLWTGAIVDSAGRTVRSYQWKGTAPARLEWDGRDESGRLFADGDYSYRLNAVDAAGNSASAATGPFRLDARRPELTLTVDKTAFSPNGDGFLDQVAVSAALSFADGLVSAKLDLVDSVGLTVGSLLSDTRAGLPGVFSLRWDGTDAGGRRLEDGDYLVAAEFRYAKGDVVRVSSPAIRLDTTPPRTRLTVGPLPFSPDGDGANDSLMLGLTGPADDQVAAWMLSIEDPYGLPFTAFSGQALPENPIEWDGMDMAGNLVEAAQDYNYTLTVRDRLGNVSRSAGAIPVDVYVLRDGDRLKIRISSITFTPQSASLTTGDAVVDAKNQAVLDKVAAALRRYPAYKVRVEGHAVNLSGTDREERLELAPLSLARAQSVVAALGTRGIEASRLTAAGLGGKEPIVPHTDTASRWKNRRVEFILIR